MFCFYLLTSCNNSDKNNQVNNSVDFKQLVQKWNKAHSSKDVATFSTLFDNKVLFYGMQYDKNSCIEDKLSLFKKNPDFYQQIFGNIEIDKINESEVKCNFVKRVTANQKTIDYPSYLVFAKRGNEWKIITEGDLVTDKNLSTKKNTKNISTSTDIFISGLKSSKVYSKKQTEDGSEYFYNCGRKLRIQFFFNQVDVMFYSYNENNQKQIIQTKFEAGYSSDGEIHWLKDNIKFLVGQYDFNADDIDELVIAIQDNDDTNNGLSINVFQLNGDTWKPIGILTGKTILGEPKANVKMNKITIPRNLRGFYYQWSFESGKFKDTGDY